MESSKDFEGLKNRFVVPGNHPKSDYFSLIRELLKLRNASEPGTPAYKSRQQQIQAVYDDLEQEIRTNDGPPLSTIKFGTSGWRGILGKDIYIQSVGLVTRAIIAMYRQSGTEKDLACALGVNDFGAAQSQGAVIGFDNRFGGDLLAREAAGILSAAGFTVYFAGESTTGCLSAALLELQAAFSINLTPSHNPLEYGGFKFNAADAGPAAPIITDRITRNCQQLANQPQPVPTEADPPVIHSFSALEKWQSLVRKNHPRHGLDYDDVLSRAAAADNLIIAVDCVHGASRVDIVPLLAAAGKNLLLLRADADPTFGGIAPEPSSVNMKPVMALLNQQHKALKLGVVIDPDADRIRFTDGTTEISMNEFGPLAYHFLHENKKKNGLVAKSVATSNFANQIARAFDEEVYEPKVGFKEFKPVIHRALVCFEESDGISIIGHTPEKDAYIGLLLAMDMMLTRQQNLGDYLAELQQKYGYFYPAKDGVVVSKKGDELKAILASLNSYQPGVEVQIGTQKKRIKELIDIDGHKMIFEDDSWLLIRPSGTEPKVRFYVEARTKEDQQALFTAATDILAKLHLI